ncbi:Rossmann-like and DUF2520 domain-containing protein [Candidatus Latescibacterota bacterium]
MNFTKPICQLIGSGRAGRAISLAMVQAGYRFNWVSSRHVSDSEKLAQQIGSSYGVGFEEFPHPAGFLIIAVPDCEITGIALEITNAGIINKDTVAAHLSGALGSEALDCLRIANASVMAFHPAQTFTIRSDPSSVFIGICFDMEGDDNACNLGEKIAHDLGAVSVRLTPVQRILTHLAMTFASNYTVSLMHLAEEIIAMADITPEIANKMLQPLLFNTARNISVSGSIDALTGPISRGDVQVIKQHLSALESMNNEIKKVYRDLARLTARIANEHGYISQDSAEEIRKILT